MSSNTTATAISALIRQRRSIFPPAYNGATVDRAIIEVMLENANWAPTHRLTEPWRFIVFQGAALERLADYLADWYKTHTPPAFFVAAKYEKTRKNPLRSAAVIAIVMQRDPTESLPEWEEIAAVSCAVQNMWLTATAYGLGGYWSSPQAILAADEWLNLAPGQRCLGLFYVGQHDNPPVNRQPGEWQDKVRWED